MVTVLCCHMKTCTKQNILTHQLKELQVLRPVQTRSGTSNVLPQQMFLSYFINYLAVAKHGAHILIAVILVYQNLLPVRFLKTKG